MQLGNAIAWQCICATGYAAAILAFGGESTSLIGALVNAWIALGQPLVRTALFFLPAPLHPSDTPGPVEIYQHLVVFSLLIACGFLFALRTSWNLWADEIHPCTDREAWPWSQRAVLRHSFSIMIVGSLSAILLLLFLGAGSQPGDSWLMTERWSYFRAPLLSTVFFAFACNAIAISRLRQQSSRTTV